MGSRLVLWAGNLTHLVTQVVPDLIVLKNLILIRTLKEQRIELMDRSTLSLPQAFAPGFEDRLGIVKRLS
ncbi:MAG: hypothetical protein DMF73_03665 [Acidobacteria bacterium]|nr:MAG: hypothetical protein DMF73_03665 [Acidobacteriota bacterium]